MILTAVRWVSSERGDLYFHFCIIESDISACSAPEDEDAQRHWSQQENGLLSAFIQCCVCHACCICSRRSQGLQRQWHEFLWCGILTGIVSIRMLSRATLDQPPCSLWCLIRTAADRRPATVLSLSLKTPLDVKSVRGESRIMKKRV